MIKIAYMYLNVLLFFRYQIRNTDNVQANYWCKEEKESKLLANMHTVLNSYEVLRYITLNLLFTRLFTPCQSYVMKYVDTNMCNMCNN